MHTRQLGPLNIRHTTNITHASWLFQRPALSTSPLHHPGICGPAQMSGTSRTNRPRGEAI